MKNFQIKNPDILHIFAQNRDCGYLLEPPRRVGFNAYTQSMFLSRNTKTNVHPCKPQFYYIKVRFKGLKLYRHVFVMMVLETMFKDRNVNSNIPHPAQLSSMNVMNLAIWVRP